MSVTARPPRPIRKTVLLKADDPGAHPMAHATEYELNDSVALPPAVRLVEGSAPRRRIPSGHVPLDAGTRALFQQRLRLCCLVAAAPIAFYLICAATNFLEPLGRSSVGWTGLVLSAVTLTLLSGIAYFLTRSPDLDENILRVVEVGMFGTMALFFAYWHFAVLTWVPPTPAIGADPDLVARHLQATALATGLIVHFNWFALIVFHGVLVPNTLARGVGVAAAMCLAALAMDGIAAAANPPTRTSAGGLFAVAGTMLAAATGLSVFGTAKTEALRREVASAREAVRELGQYRLRRKLGVGGMGEVYLAEHQLLKRPCALKRIHPRYLNNPEQVRRFEREVQATAQLRHPNTVEIYDYGRADDGTFYYVMEYLPGLSLEEMVGRVGPLPAERVVHILRQVCGALREAHRLGLVHRDIKPSNILVFPQGSPHDQAKLLDFGLVHSLTEEVDPEAKITREGLIVGTPEYMSPEQASGCTLDGRSDLFSLGTVAYFLLTGREAFHRENPMKTLLAVVNEPPNPVAQYNATVPEDVVAVLKRCLMKPVGERFDSAADLEHALMACGCAGLWTEERAAEWWLAHPDTQSGTGTDLNSLPLQDSLGST